MTMTALDRALVTGDAGRVTGERQDRPDPEVPEKARVLRRGGLNSSHVIEWRRARDAGVLAGPARQPGRPAADPPDAQIARLTKEKARLEQELARARFVVDVQSKLQALLETISEGADTTDGRGS
jgi:transposase